ncbi:MAG: hypothetical protein Q6367_007120 [Candidatus Freyarchaeota archaeon]
MMWRKAIMQNTSQIIYNPNGESILYEICRWCTWHQKLNAKTFFGAHTKTPHKKCPNCGCPTTIIYDEIIYACGVCGRILVEKYVISLNSSKKVCNVEYAYECYHCANTSKITALHICGDGKLGECDALYLNETGEPLAFECIRCHKKIPNTTA